MNTNLNAKRILVYGDSLPWGLVSGSKTFERFPSDIRWPGKLQSLLGDKYEVIEECLCARTIDSDDLRPGFEGRNGLAYLVPCLDSHDPVDIIVLSLGLNEVKSIFEWTPAEVAEKMQSMVDLAAARKPNFHEVSPQIILLSPIAVDEAKTSEYWGELWVGSGAKSRKLALEFSKLSGVKFVDISDSVEPGVDGVHLDKAGHENVAEMLADTIGKKL